MAEYILALIFLLIMIDNVSRQLISTNNKIMIITCLIIIELFIVIHVLRNGFADFIEANTFNEIDEFLVSLLVSLLIYLVLEHFLFLSKCYIMIPLMIALCFITSVIIIRLIHLKRFSSSHDNNRANHDLVTLYDIYKNSFTLGHNIVVKEKAGTQDLLNRGLIINELKDAMTLEHGGNAFTIGVEGEWGAGKTTLINLTLDKIINENNTHIKIISDFDPWIFGTNEALLVSLYEEILKCVGVKYNTFKLRHDLKKLTSILASVSKQTWFDKLFDDHFGYSDLKQMKRELTEILNKENEVVIIVFDNLDRMNSENVLFLFKLIGTIFDLPHINYVLSYDDKRLDDIFSESLKINPKYKEKIINQVISIPGPDRDKLNEIYTTCISNILSKKQVIKLENINDYIDFLTKKVNDLRNFIRILNSNINRVFFYYSFLNLNELLVLELIRFRNKHLYELIKINNKILISLDVQKKADVFSFRLDKEDCKNKRAEFLKYLRENYSEDLDMVLFLFPDLEGDDLHAKQKKTNIVSIRSAKYFDLYFSYGINNFLMIYNKVDSFIQSVNNAKSVGNIETAACELEILRAHESIQFEMVNEIDKRITNIERSQCLNLMMFFWNHIEEFSDFGEFLALSAHQRAEVIIAELINQLKPKELGDFIDSHLNYYGYINTISEIKYWLTTASLSANKNIINIWTNYYNKMCEDILSNNIDLYADQYYSRGNIVGLKRFKEDYREMIYTYIRNIIRPKYVYRILGDCVGSSHGSTHNYGIDQSLFDDMGVSQETMDQYLSEFKPENESQKFILDLYQRFKNGEKIVMGDYPVKRNKPFYFNDL